MIISVKSFRIYSWENYFVAEENSNRVHCFHHKNSNNFVFCITHTLHIFPIFLFFNCLKRTYVYDTLDNTINHSDAIGVIYTNNYCTFHTKYCMWKYLTPYNCVYTILRKRNTITKKWNTYVSSHQICKWYDWLLPVVVHWYH